MFFKNTRKCPNVELNTLHEYFTCIILFEKYSGF